MKTMRKENFLRYAFLAVVMLIATALLVPFAQTRKTASAEIAYETAYVGDVMEAEQYDIAWNGETVKAEGLTVVYPSGGVYGGEQFVMSQAGTYQVTYYATVDDERVEETRYYMAVRMPKDVIMTEEGMQVDYGKYEVESPYEIKNEAYGAIVTFKAGQTITFSSTIETAKLTADYNILDLIVMPSVFKETDFEKLSIRITDSKDTNNYVDVIVLSSNTVDGEGQVSYVQAGAKGQQIGGYEGSTFHFGSLNYGTSVEHSFRGLGREGEFRHNHTISEGSLTIAIDNAERKVYCGPYSNTVKDLLMVNDLDDSAHYKGNPWNGFTSDEVTVSVTADRFVKAEGKVLIKTFGDLDFSTAIEDTLAPQVIVECDETKPMPIAIVGRNFPIFPFVAKDALDAQVKTNVFVYYLDARGEKITVANDGENFFVKYAGQYQIVYRAEDYSGNVTEKVLEVSAETSMQNIYIALEESLVWAEVYDTVSIPMESEMYVFGGSGNLKVERNIYNPNNEKMDVANALQLTMLGDYKVVYSVTDYLGDVEYGVMTVRATALEKPKFINEPTFESVLVKGFRYELKQPFVVETIDGEVKVTPCKVYINDVLTENSFVADGESVNIRYVAEGATGASEWSNTISVVDTESGKYKSQYFYSEDNMEVRDEKSYVELLFAEDCTTEFINSLCAQDFRVVLSYEQEMLNFSKMTFVLTDAENKNRTITIDFYYNPSENAWFMQLNNRSDRISYVTSKNIFTFELSKNSKSIIDASGVGIAKITAYDNGEVFNGFDSLYLSFSFADVKGASSIMCSQIGNQTMGYNKSSIDKAKDEIKPIILLDEPFLIRQKLGSKAKIPTAKAYDVLGQVTEFIVKVETVSGELLASGPATEVLDFTLDKPGYYLVTYYAKDSNGNSESIPYTILVSDETAPTLTVKNSLKDQYKQNSVVTIPTYSAVDNGENCYIQVTLILPNNEVRLLQYSENGQVTSYLTADSELYESAFKASSNSFVALYKGRYVLRVVAYDEYYNYTVKEIEFIVK